jgi:8-amino-7-oxononanoate synthase
VARKVIYPHLDVNFLESELRTCGSGASQKFIVTESIFSMDGDCAPIDDLLILADKYGAELIVDEAHATGVVGPCGRGVVAATGAAVLATVHPCGKAFAGVGAFVCCSETLKQYLVNRARTFIFSTALPPYVAAQMHAALAIVADADEQRATLARLSSFARTCLKDAGFDTGRSASQIVPVMLGDNDRAVQFAQLLTSAGFGVRAIRPPTVPAGTSRLRLSLTATMTSELIERITAAMVEIRERLTPVSCNAAR